MIVESCSFQVSHVLQTNQWHIYANFYRTDFHTIVYELKLLFTFFSFAIVYAFVQFRQLVAMSYYAVCRRLTNVVCCLVRVRNNAIKQWLYEFAERSLLSPTFLYKSFSFSFFFPFFSRKK